MIKGNNDAANMCDKDCEYCNERNEYKLNHLKFNPMMNIKMCKKYINSNLNHILNINSKSKIMDTYHDIIFDGHTSKDLSKDSVSFSGGGYNCVYHLGVIKYIFENQYLFKNTKFLGASGGAGIVSLILAYENNEYKFDTLNNILNDIIELNKLDIKLQEQVEKYTQIICNYIDEDKFNKCIKNSNRCYISLTDVTYLIPSNVIKYNFKTYDEFISTLRASACIPFLLDNKIRNIDGRYYLDGGLSNNLPILSNKTIRISCLNYPFLQADIYPKIISEIGYSFYPPNKNYILNLYDLGYSDMFEFMIKYKKNVNNFLEELYIENIINRIINDF